MMWRCSIGGGGENSPLAEHSHIRFLPMVKLDKYPAMLDAIRRRHGAVCWTHASIAAKSDLKFIEYALVGMPTMVSDVEPYARTVRHGETGFMAKNEKDWMTYIRRLVDDPELRARSVRTLARTQRRA